MMHRDVALTVHTAQHLARIQAMLMRQGMSALPMHLQRQFCGLDDQAIIALALEALSLAMACVQVSPSAPRADSADTDSVAATPKRCVEKGSRKPKSAERKRAGARKDKDHEARKENDNGPR